MTYFELMDKLTKFSKDASLITLFMLDDFCWELEDALNSNEVEINELINKNVPIGQKAFQLIETFNLQ